jgi:ribosomal protein S18 acetylase RimI-like enzyme
MEIVPYSPDFRAEHMRFWRESFEQGVGITDPNPIEDQTAYFENSVLPESNVSVVVEHGHPIAFLAATGEMVLQLYVHVDHQRRGIGTQLLDRAKAESGGTLRLFTLLSNTGAQAFYERHGFRVIRRGFESQWQLEDLEYEWTGE